MSLTNCSLINNKFPSKTGQVYLLLLRVELGAQLPCRLGDLQIRLMLLQAAYPWRILLMSANLLVKLDSIHRCGLLRKLDLSHNAIDQLPNKNFWLRLPKLEVLPSSLLISSLRVLLSDSC